MHLLPGTRLGPYEILAPVGAGGMGEVYRGRDTRLDRIVAIKVLAEHLALNPDLRRRFEREARAVSSLSHPHIGVLYDIGNQDGTDYLVLEYLEGESLQARVKKGPLALDQTLRIGIEIGDALDKAHRKGVIHRDIKPGNVMLTRAGAKLLDFGLAQQATPVLSGGDDLSHLPTPSEPLTTNGPAGTIPYMAPEQVEGHEADARTDLWGFGAVLYEMTTGRLPFVATSAARMVGAILKDEPSPMRELRPETPPTLERLVMKCLAKDPDERWQSAHDLVAELRWIFDERSRGGDAGRSRPGGLGRVVPWLLAATALPVAGGTLWMRSAPAAGTPRVTHLDVAFPADVEPALAYEDGFALSPDGRIVAMVGTKSGARAVFVRRLDGAEVLAISVPGWANGAAFSPDSTQIALGTSGTVTSYSLVDGRRTLVASSADATGTLAWGAAGIVFVRGGALWIAHADGGEPRALTTLDAGRHEVLHARPLFVAGGRTVLFASLTAQTGSERIEAVSVDGGPRHVILERAHTPLWSPTGHLLFARDGAVLATEFDEAAMRVRGEPIAILPRGLVAASMSGALGLRVAPSGTLVYMPKGAPVQRLVEVARGGSARTLDLARGDYSSPRVSPDGHRVTVVSDLSHLETFDLERGTQALLTGEAPGTDWFAWTGDGSRIVYRRLNHLSWVSADGRDQRGEVEHPSVLDYPTAPGPDADSVLVTRTQPATSGDVYLLSLSGSFPARPLVSTPAYEGGAELSPDGHWLAYVSNESGKPDVLVRRFPELDRQWEVSEGGGGQLHWSASGREIYYRGRDSMMAVPFDGRASVPVMGKPLPLFRDEYDRGLGITVANYAVTPDGRFLMLRREARGGDLRIVLDWTEELKRILASGGPPPPP
jgi:eukaryotic-like serine/threonine-protein kinase